MRRTTAMRATAFAVGIVLIGAGQAVDRAAARDRANTFSGSCQLSGTPQHERRARTRAALLRAAGRVFAEQGFHRATLEAVAAAAGVSKGALYHYFPSKEQLFLALLEDRLGAGISDIEAVARTNRRLGIPEIEGALLSPDELGLVLAALVNGLAIERAFDPGVVPKDLLPRLFIVLRAGLSATANSPTESS